MKKLTPKEALIERIINIALVIIGLYGIWASFINNSTN